MSRKPGIPAIPVVSQELQTVLQSLKENIELITGVRGGNIATLATTASLSDTITKVNEIITRLNGR
jgi:hypothetical protein